MSLELSGTTGVKGVAGSVSAPSIVGDDTNTGISFPSADTIKFSTGGVERMAITNSGVTGISPGITMADQWKVSTSQTTSSDTLADITGWARNTNNFAGIGSALTNSGANFTFPSTGIYYIRYQIATYITTGASRYISARLYFNGSTICMPWASSQHNTGNQTLQTSGSQAILDVTDTSNTFKIQMQSQNPVVVVGNNEAGYSGTATMSDVVVIRLGDT